MINFLTTIIKHQKKLAIDNISLDRQTINFDDGRTTSACNLTRNQKIKLTIFPLLQIRIFTQLQISC